MLFVFYYFIFFNLPANTILRPMEQLSYEAFVKLSLLQLDYLFELSITA